MSDPVLTKYGYHLILITDKKPSDLAFLPKNEYENAIINLSKTSVRNKLRAAAINYDSLQLKRANLSFNFTTINRLINLYNKKHCSPCLTSHKDHTCCFSEGIDNIPFDEIKIAIEELR